MHTIGRINQDIRELDKQLEKVRAERIAQGLPADPLILDISSAMAWTLFERLKPLIDFAAKYADLCDKTNSILEISDEQMEWIKSHEMSVKLLDMSRRDLSILALSVASVYKTLIGYEDKENASDILRDVSKHIKTAQPDYGRSYRLCDLLYDTRLTSAENQRKVAKVEAEIERLKDESYFEKEYTKLVEKYKSLIGGR